MISNTIHDYIVQNIYLLFWIHTNRWHCGGADKMYYVFFKGRIFCTVTVAWMPQLFVLRCSLNENGSCIFYRRSNVLDAGLKFCIHPRTQVDVRSGGTRIFVCVCVGGGHRGGKMQFWGNKNPKICRKRRILAFFSSDGGGGKWGKNLRRGGGICPHAPLMPPLDVRAISPPVYTMHLVYASYLSRNVYYYVYADKKISSLDKIYN